MSESVKCDHYHQHQHQHHRHDSQKQQVDALQSRCDALQSEVDVAAARQAAAVEAALAAAEERVELELRGQQLTYEGRIQAGRSGFGCGRNVSSEGGARALYDCALKAQAVEQCINPHSRSTQQRRTHQICTPLKPLHTTEPKTQQQELELQARYMTALEVLAPPQPTSTSANQLPPLLPSDSSASPSPSPAVGTAAAGGESARGVAASFDARLRRIIADRFGRAEAAQVRAVCCALCAVVSSGRVVWRGWVGVMLLKRLRWFRGVSDRLLDQPPL